jgi:uracil phosphoribosyltransferase
MLATGQSIVSTLKALQSYGTPKKIHIVSIIGAKPGIEYVSEYVSTDVILWVGTIDKELNSQSYIVPGLGDAGDLAYGQKLQQ